MCRSILCKITDIYRTFIGHIGHIGHILFSEVSDIRRSGILYFVED